MMTGGIPISGNLQIGFELDFEITISTEQLELNDSRIFRTGLGILSVQDQVEVCFPGFGDGPLKFGRL